MNPVGTDVFVNDVLHHPPAAEAGLEANHFPAARVSTAVVNPDVANPAGSLAAEYDQTRGVAHAAVPDDHILRGAIDPQSVRIAPRLEADGIIIALEDDPKIRRALIMTPIIEFYRYQVSFKLVKG